MKIKFIFLFGFVIFLSCTKDEPSEYQKYSLDQFKGSWEFEFLKYGGNTYFINYNNEGPNPCTTTEPHIIFLFHFIYDPLKEFTTMIFPCNNLEKGYYFDLGPGINQVEFFRAYEENSMLIKYESHSFKIMELINDKLVMKLIGSTDPRNPPINGLFHFQRID